MLISASMMGDLPGDRGPLNGESIVAQSRCKGEALENVSLFSFFAAHLEGGCF